ncbi:hypothetical protein [Allokutzneria albata]|uniref:Uncharacterized protein n=1 Tax=Allokutzneria albata TaxID=211114 RepID=A0A1G9SZT0_ALLAB|nr:hypothetical protein [Allokutzneria albata]SDM40910.1 hypothetical protein SAMN04489726_1474 [Allokutzneria albata]
MALAHPVRVITDRRARAAGVISAMGIALEQESRNHLPGYRDDAVHHRSRAPAKT